MVVYCVGQRGVISETEVAPCLFFMHFWTRSYWDYVGTFFGRHVYRQRVWKGGA